ncbi:MAG: DNA mismatch repair endonuclease MutL [Planctomycetota bacterium]|jgi:DNA mismatch repair protein MutL|nr:DNA mismatch repair endonuclease MutL [Planctomycetota bacterium]
MGRIQVLPETVQNKIAAGEVVERPASAVKELVENALDAGATSVAVELDEGGHRLIRVSDDGRGMDEDDLVLALQRHATSKIRDVDDIFRIASFGFRGEALPSLASVSRLNVVSCPEGGEEGREIAVEGGKIIRLSPAPARRGTRVEVRDIFFNTPARRKFLRQPSSESSRTGETLTRLALGNPEVAFRFQANGRLLMGVRPAGSQMERAADLFGRDEAVRFTPFALDASAGLSISGFFSRPPRSCRNSRDIYILVNRRWIRSPALARAMADAFQGTLPPRGYPFAVVNLDIDPARVDVNVHPTKEEVRFEQESLVIGGLRRAVKEALARLALAPAIVSLAAFPQAGMEKAVMPRTGKHEPGGWPDAPPDFALSRHDGATPPGMAAAGDRLHASFPETIRTTRAAAETVRDKTADPDPASPTQAGARQNDTLSLGHASRHRILGQAGGRYILVDGPGGILLIDPHALHERWNYDRLREERTRGAASRRLVLPLDVELSPAEAGAAPEAVPELAEHGFELRLVRPNLLRVLACPEFIKPGQVENLLRQLLSDIDEGRAGDAVETARDHLLASLACRSSVLLGHAFPEAEMLALLDRFFNQGQLPTCPHGRPTAIRIGWEELARRFGRS